MTFAPFASTLELLLSLASSCGASARDVGDAEVADAEPEEPPEPPKPKKEFDVEWAETVPDDKRPKMKWSTEMNSQDADIGLNIDGYILSPVAREGRPVAQATKFHGVFSGKFTSKFVYPI